ncbi:hypothetical protein B0T24DRAFT_643357 [Lasiosphaeria ovina]|uniref:Uncharacterized protein n=1 Tax=Lasiosphaeria ovina TaxID=92902 RepID=A0AAE0JSE0_9PEZI|nr:hypothetical protein B0T24DRAFT_643357 [Lasiosphaeria ovina]
MLQQYSLENLLEISRHRVFGPALKTLTICVDHLPQELSRREKRVVKRPVYKRLLEEQKFMMESGLNTTYLTQAIAAFPSLETIVVDDDFFPGGPTALERQTGVPLATAMDHHPDSVEFVVRTLRAIILAIAASNISLDGFDISVRGINSGMLFFPKPVLRYIQSHPINLTSLCLSVSLPSSIHPSGELVGDLLGFLAGFQGLQRLSLGFSLGDEPEHFTAISQALRLPGLRFLGITNVQCTESELVTLLLGHKDSLEKVSFTFIDIILEGGSRQSLLATIRDELSIKCLTMTRCRWADKVVYFRESGSDDKSGSDGETDLNDFEIGGSWQDWTDDINCIMIGRSRM